MNKFLLKTCIIFVVVVFLSLLVREQVLANGWQFESGLGLPPSLLGIDPTAGPAEFVAYVFILALGSAGVLAMLFIIIGGIRYMGAAGNSGTQSDAKDQILSAILGLLLLLATVLILSTISPQFTSLENPTLPDAGIPEGGESLAPDEFKEEDFLNDAQIKICWDTAVNETDFMNCVKNVAWQVICDKELGPPQSCSWLCLKLTPIRDCDDECSEILGQPQPLPISDTCESCLINEGIIQDTVYDGNKDVECPPDPPLFAPDPVCVAEAEKWEINRFDFCRCNMVGGSIWACPGEHCGDIPDAITGGRSGDLSDPCQTVL